MLANRYITLLLPILFWIAFGYIKPQEMTAVHVVKVTYANRGDVPEEYVQTFSNRLIKNISDEGLKLIQIEFVNEKDRLLADLNIDFWTQFDDQHLINGRFVSVNVPVNYLVQISPILMAEHKFHIEDNPEQAADLTMAIYEYTKLGNCDKGDNYSANKDYTPEIIHYFKGVCGLLNKNLDSAIQNFELAFPSDPNLIPYLASKINLSWSYFALGDGDKAFNLLNDTLKQSENMSLGVNADILIARAQLYNLAFHYDAAISDLNAAIQFSPADPALYTLRGQTYLLLYEWDNVATDYNKAIELDPTYADAYFYRGVLYYSILQTGQAMYTDALDDFQHYLELAPDGEHAVEATRYASDIQTQINALNN